MNAIQKEKLALRREIRKRIAGLTPPARLRQSSSICASLLNLPAMPSKGVVLAFASLPDEVNLDELWDAGLDLALPRVNGEILEIWRVPDLAALKPGTLGIREPDPGTFESVHPGKIQVILVPGVAFSRNGRRLGRGGGFYDRFLAESSALKIGICFQEQLVESVPCEAHDIPVDFVVSSTGQTE